MFHKRFPQNKKDEISKELDLYRGNENTVSLSLVGCRKFFDKEWLLLHKRGFDSWGVYVPVEVKNVDGNILKFGIKY